MRFIRRQADANGSTSGAYGHAQEAQRGRSMRAVFRPAPGRRIAHIFNRGAAPRDVARRTPFPGVSRACRSCELRASTCPYSVDAPTPSRRDSWLMQPPRDRSVTLVQRRHVDLVRVASAVCRCR
ncbi:putative leader peptide [Streptomyces sp. NPDC055721]|uniref:putative leader peptide n=1 Tax=Streptomyces sp. NPDC127132 TaxID=3345374 RepID=UPI0036423B7D